MAVSLEYYYRTSFLAPLHYHNSVLAPTQWVYMKRIQVVIPRISAFFNIRFFSPNFAIINFQFMFFYVYYNIFFRILYLRLKYSDFLLNIYFWLFYLWLTEKNINYKDNWNKLWDKHFIYSLHSTGDSLGSDWLIQEWLILENCIRSSTWFYYLERVSILVIIMKG